MKTETIAPSRFARRIGYFLAVAIVTFAAIVLVRSLRKLSAGDIEAAFHAIPVAALWTCTGLTGLSFIVLGLYDVIAVRLIAPNRVSWRRAWFAGAAANGISNTVGLHALTAAAVRHRIYSRSSLALADIVRVTSLSWTALAFGFAAMFALAVMLSPVTVTWQRISGGVLAGLLLLVAKWLGPGRKISVWSVPILLPPGKVALVQMALGALEMATAVAGLYVLMPRDIAISFPAFSVIYIGAVLLGIASHAPGGIGIFEATILTLSHDRNRAGALAALLIYRLIYNLLPFAMVTIALAVEEIRAVVNSSADSGR